MACGEGSWGPAVAGEGVVNGGLSAYASTRGRASGNGPCLHLRATPSLPRTCCEARNRSAAQRCGWLQSQEAQPPTAINSHKRHGHQQPSTVTRGTATNSHQQSQEARPPTVTNSHKRHGHQQPPTGTRGTATNSHQQAQEAQPPTVTNSHKRHGHQQPPIITRRIAIRLCHSCRQRGGIAGALAMVRSALLVRSTVRRLQV